MWRARFEPFLVVLIWSQYQRPSSQPAGEQDSLITAEISLIARFNSLLGIKEFPVRACREIGRKGLTSRPFSLPMRRVRPPMEQNSLYFPSEQGIWPSGDEFAHDCLLQR
jgi:hypothetical protein